MKLKEFAYLHKADRQVILALLAVIAVVTCTIFLIGGKDATPNPQSPLAAADSAAQAPHRNPQQPYFQQPERQVERFYFDPNTADSTQLLRLGLRPWQVRNIYKYRAAGGIYQKKEDFARLYGLTVKEYRELEPYIRISADYLPAATLVPARERPATTDSTTRRDTLRYPLKLAENETINLTTADTALLKRVPGIGSYYARRIVDYGKRLGGYVSLSQLDEIEDFPTTAKAFITIEDNPQVRKLNLNKLTVNELKRHPYINYYQARAIADYRRLHGPLKDLDDLSLLPDFPAEAIARLRPYVEY